VVRFVLQKFPRLRRVTIVCGKGNNGGDGFVAARKFGDEGRRTTVILLCDPSELKGDAAEMFKRMREVPLVVKSAEDLKSAEVAEAWKADVIVDAILGTGFKPPVRGIYEEAMAAINAGRKPVVAVDIPSGADADSVSVNAPIPKEGKGGAPKAAVITSERCRADHVVTFTAPRPAHVFGGVTKGDTMVAPIGSPEEAIQSQLGLKVITPRDFVPLLADRNPEGHKGTYGHVLVVGGSFGKAGAAAMAGLSVLRSGAGLSTIAAPKSVLPMVAAFTPEIMTEPLAETEQGTISPDAYKDERVAQVLEGKDVVALGPGIGRLEETTQFVRTFANDCKVPLVIDADGLNAFDGHLDLLSGEKRTLVLTPHPGEMSRLTGMKTAEIQEDRIGVATKFASDHGCILVLKGHRTLVALPDGTAWVNVTGNAGMATGGSGDVLTGMIAGLMAQAGDYAMAVIAAVYLHGLAGDVAREKIGEASMIAGDITANIGEAFKRAKQALALKGFLFHG
jgi:ADP-dependent NAD(P)H-hydrate dehydratase / NAD(P)H-hydrate epimerase